MSNSTVIQCPRCLEIIHLIQRQLEVEINTAFHEPKCTICREYDHTTENHYAFVAIKDALSHTKKHEDEKVE